jgi:replicative DNA helicase
MADDSPTTTRGPADAFAARGAPHDAEAEFAVLGAMYLDQDAAVRATELLTDEMFHHEQHRRLFRAMATLTERRVVLDDITLPDELSRRGELEMVGGAQVVAELADAVPTAANLDYHAGIVREKWVLRRLIAECTELVTEAYSGRQPATDLLDKAESRIFQIGRNRAETGFVRIKELIWPAMERVEALSRSNRSVTGVPSGFVDLDNLTAGFQPSELIIVAARPSMGKTAFVLNVATHAASEGIGTAIFSLEMSRHSLLDRMLCAEARVDASALKRGGLRDFDYTKLARAAGVLQGCPVFIDDSPGVTLMEMRSKARRLRAENQIGLVIVDYLQLMKSPEYADNRVQEISDISRSLKQLARELQVPVIALSQLSRAAEQRGGERIPMLSDLRDSGAIEQDADVVIFIHRPEYYQDLRMKAEQEGRNIEGLAEVIVAKHRNGPTGSVPLFFHKRFTRFDNMSQRQSPSDDGPEDY